MCNGGGVLTGSLARSYLGRPYLWRRPAERVGSKTAARLKRVWTRSRLYTTSLLLCARGRVQTVTLTSLNNQSLGCSKAFSFYKLDVLVYCLSLQGKCGSINNICGDAARPTLGLIVVEWRVV